MVYFQAHITHIKVSQLLLLVGVIVEGLKVGYAHAMEELRQVYG